MNDAERLRVLERLASEVCAAARAGNLDAWERDELLEHLHRIAQASRAERTSRRDYGYVR